MWHFMTTPVPDSTVAKETTGKILLLLIQRLQQRMQQREPNVKGFIKSLHPIFIFNTNTAILRSSEKFYFLTR